MSDCPYDMNLEKFYLDQKNTVHTLKIDRGEIAEILAKYPMEYSQFDCDMIIEYEDQLREQGFDMERIDDIELVKDWNQEMSLIFLQRAED